MLGMFGGTLIVFSSTAVLFGAYDQVGPVGLLVALPVFAWEVSFALWLIIKGFNTPQPAADSVQRLAADDPALSPA
jgi:hypothetical protein